MKFQVEYIFEYQHVYILARSLERQGFSLSATSTLGGVPIQRWVDQPRKLHPDGTPDLDVYAFVLQHNDDKTEFVVNQIVELCE